MTRVAVTQVTVTQVVQVLEDLREPPGVVEDDRSRGRRRGEPVADRHDRKLAGGSLPVGGERIERRHEKSLGALGAQLAEQVLLAFGVAVRVGEYVREGQPIGRSGNTGLSAAPHLHYEVRYLGRRLDPRPFLDWSLNRYDLVFDEEERVQWESLAETVRSKVRVLDPRSSDPAPSWSAISP